MLRVAANEGVAGTSYLVMINCQDHGGQGGYYRRLNLLGGRQRNHIPRPTGFSPFPHPSRARPSGPTKARWTPPAGPARRARAPHHCAGLLTPEAVSAAADPARFPDQDRLGRKGLGLISLSLSPIASEPTGAREPTSPQPGCGWEARSYSHRRSCRPDAEVVSARSGFCGLANRGQEGYRLIAASARRPLPTPPSRDFSGNDQSLIRSTSHACARVIQSFSLPW